MKAIIYKITVVLMLFPLVSFSLNAKKRIEKKKTIKKEFNVNPNATININNRYGNVDITTWNENRVTFEIIITVKGRDEGAVEEKLDDITVSFNENAQEIIAKTHISNKSKSWFSWFGSSNNLNYKINYIVKMPKSNNLTIYNDYGNIYLNEIDGKTNINCDYGKIVLGSLNNSNNEINIDYSRNSSIEFIKSGSIDADYSSFSIDAAKNIALNADYTTSNFENIEKLEYNCDYGKLSVENVNYIIGEGDYLSMQFGKIFKELDVNTDYGSLRIEQMQPNFKNVTINSDYTGIKIGIDQKTSSLIDVKVSYGSIKYEGNFTFTKKNSKTTSKHYQGYLNDKKSSSKIKINSDYGGIKLITN